MTGIRAAAFVSAGGSAADTSGRDFGRASARASKAVRGVTTVWPLGGLDRSATP